jgi:acyl carrier protein
VSPAAIDEQRVRQIIAEVYERTQRDREIDWLRIGNEEALYSEADGGGSLGLDSLDVVEIATELEEAFDVVMPAELDPAEVGTIRSVVAMLQRLVQEQHASE